MKLNLYTVPLVAAMLLFTLLAGSSGVLSAEPDASKKSAVRYALSHKYYLGIHGYNSVFQQESQDVYCVYIDHVYADSPAEKAGVKAGGFLTRVNNKRVETLAEMVKELDASPSGKATLKIFYYDDMGQLVPKTYKEIQMKELGTTRAINP
jgi:S1-C subfamily serine protease